MHYWLRLNRSSFTTYDDFTHRHFWEGNASEYTWRCHFFAFYYCSCRSRCYMSHMLSTFSSFMA
ncbi:Uncharacterised protein [Vibrio cholerae]|nr:Uncharacterised protein [Vibrio cholerae]